MSASDIDLGFEAGPIVSLAKQVNETTTAEILYFGIDGWSGSTSVTSAGGITTSRFDAGATLLDQVDATFSSQIHNIEVNCQRTISARLQWLLGFRWTELDESAGVLWDGRSTGSDYCTITSGAENKLYGLQLGLSGTLWQPSARLHLDGFFKAGAFANRMATNWSAAGTFATISSGSRSVDRTSVLGEIGLLGTFDVTERIALTAGYQLMWIDGVATGFSPLGSQDVDTVFYHGLRLMVEARW